MAFNTSADPGRMTSSSTGAYATGQSSAATRVTGALYTDTRTGEATERPAVADKAVWQAEGRH